MDRRHAPCGWFLAGIILAGSLVSSPTFATLIFYYDPDTGNVSFDSSETRSGWTYLYGLFLREDPGFTFRFENQIRLSNSTLYQASPTGLSDTSFSDPFAGLYTIGDVLPPGLTSDLWVDLFAGYVHATHMVPRPSFGAHTYADVVGGGAALPAEFRYGTPEGDFKNRWDLVDPDTIDWATGATLIYHAWSGNVIMDTTGPEGGHISAFLLSSRDLFIPENFTPSIDSPLISRNADGIALFADAIEPGYYSLGRILDAHLSPEEFESAFTEAKFLERAGFAGGSFDFEAHGANFSLMYQAVPEPFGLLPLGIGLLLVHWRLRRSVA